MPKLTQYTRQAQSSAGQSVISATAEAFGGDGGGLRQAGQDVLDFAGVLKQRAETQEVSEARKQLSLKRVEWTQHLYDSAENMAEGGSGFTDQIVSDFQDFSDKADNQYQTSAGQRVWSEGLASMRGDLAVRSIAIESGARGKKAVADYKAGSQADQNTLQLDPTQLEDVLTARLATIDALPIGAEARRELSDDAHTELAEAAVRGEIRKDPVIAEANLVDGVYAKFFDSDETKALIGEANTAQRARQIEDAAAQTRANAADKKARDAAKTDFMVRFATNENVPSLQEIAANPYMTSEDLNFFMNLVEKQTTGPIKTNTAAFSEIFTRINMNEDDPLAITDAAQVDVYVQNGTLSFSDRNQLVSYIEKDSDSARPTMKDMRKNAYKTVRDNLTGSNPLLNVRDPEGNRLYGLFEQDALTYVEEVMAADDTVTEREFYDPNSKYYLGNLAAKYQRTLAEIMASTYKIGGVLQGFGATVDYATPEELQAALNAGTVSGPTAQRIATEKGWAQ